MSRAKKAMHIETRDVLLQAWCEAAEAWRRLRSDSTEARCRAARVAFYAATWGTVPPLREEAPAKQSDSFD